MCKFYSLLVRKYVFNSNISIQFQILLVFNLAIKCLLFYATCTGIHNFYAEISPEAALITQLTCVISSGAFITYILLADLLRDEPDPE